MALQRGLKGHDLDQVVLAGAGFDYDQRVGAFGDELQGVQPEAGRAWQLVLEALVEDSQLILLV